LFRYTILDIISSNAPPFWNICLQSTQLCKPQHSNQNITTQPYQWPWLGPSSRSSCSPNWAREGSRTVFGASLFRAKNPKINRGTSKPGSTAPTTGGTTESTPGPGLGRQAKLVVARIEREEDREGCSAPPYFGPKTQQSTVALQSQGQRHHQRGAQPRVPLALAWAVKPKWLQPELGERRSRRVFGVTLFRPKNPTINLGTSKPGSTAPPTGGRTKSTPGPGLGRQAKLVAARIG
jgi:hypothetical protein